MTIEAEDFEQWRAHPVTEAVTRALVKLAERNKEQWMEISWGGGTADQSTLIELKARAEMCQDLSELTVDELNEALDEEQQRRESNGVQATGTPEEG